MRSESVSISNQRLDGFVTTHVNFTLLLKFSVQPKTMYKSYKVKTIHLSMYKKIVTVN